MAEGWSKAVAWRPLRSRSAFALALFYELRYLEPLLTLLVGLLLELGGRASEARQHLVCPFLRTSNALAALASQ